MRLAAALALLALSCAPVQQRASGGGGGPPDAGELSGAFLAGDDLLVIPLARPDSAAAANFEIGLRAGAASRGIATRWIWSAGLVTAHRRNPTLVPNPYTLATHELRGAGIAAEGSVPQRLSGELRTMVAVAGGRRFVLLPHEASLQPTGAGVRARVRIILIDTRRQLIGWERWVDGEPRATPAEAFHSAGERTAGLFVSE